MIFKHEVVSNKRLNDKFISVKFKANDPSFSFKSGQFIFFVITREACRCYSFASSPSKLPYWEIFVDTTPGGIGTTYLKNLKIGNTVTTLEPQGRFLIKNKNEKYLFAGTGCGIGPFLSMFEDLSKIPEKKVSLLWGLKKEEDIAMTDVFEEYKNKYSNFSFEVILSEPNSAWKGKTGHIQDYLSEKIEQIKKDNMAIYLSGSTEFVLQAGQLLQEGGFPAKRVHTEWCY
jgi:ferredoxin-NADP reductase